ncbi:MAG: hypothetical protein FWF34_00685 [Alphaproteobacteria bacterium]|nr:hypothetical protein [Alphaproteobacteria bacterium]MCL2889762.1 hypothetical protein [Alphaproteobacteria bacterium]
MAFANKNLSVIAYANGFTLWHYAENAAAGDIQRCGYFNSVKTLMNIGDIIIINAADGAALRAVIATDANVTIGAIL